MLRYTSFDVLPPFLVHRTSRVDEDRYATLEHALGQRVDTLFSAAPIAYRAQNGGDYQIPRLTLREEVAPGQAGFHAHVVSHRP